MHSSQKLHVDQLLVVGEEVKVQMSKLDGKGY